MKANLDPLIHATHESWHAVTLNMSWHFRTAGCRAVPAMVLAAFGGEAPTREEWELARKMVTAGRRAIRDQAQRGIEAQRREARRRYMASYMRQRRSRVAHG